MCFALKEAEIALKYNLNYIQDKDLKIRWPIKNPIVSKRDKMALTFNEYKKIKLNIKGLNS